MTRKHHHNLKKIKSGIRKYAKGEGNPPSQKSGDATEYVGYKTTWSAVSQWLKNNGHGSLSQLSKEMGLDTRYAPHDLKAIKSGLRAFYKGQGKTPLLSAGDASAYVGYATTWRAVDGWLRYNGHGSLPLLCKEMGFEGHHAEHSFKAIKSGLRKFYNEQGKTPGVLDGDATKYVGYKTTWVAVNQWLRKSGHGSLTALGQELGLSSRAQHNFEAIKRGIKRYVREHGRSPTQKAGDAESDVGYETTWAAVDGWLRRQGTSLRDLYQSPTPSSKALVKSAFEEGEQD